MAKERVVFKKVRVSIFPLRINVTFDTKKAP